MLRRTTYRTAANLILFLGLWFVIGAVVLWSPLPDALGIAGPLFSVWLVLLFLVMGVAGGALLIASINNARGPMSRPARRRAARDASATHTPPHADATQSRRAG